MKISIEFEIEQNVETVEIVESEFKSLREQLNDL